MDAYGQIGTGIIPLPGTPAYEAALRNLLNAQPGQGGAAIGDTQSQALQAYNTLVNNTGQSFGIVDPAIAKLGGTTGGSSGSMFSNQATGAGLLNEILGLIRGTGEKQFSTARNRLNEDYGTAREMKIHDLARRGLFRAGTGEEEMQREIEKPYTRGMSDLESNMADANTDLGLRKAGILAEIEARARQQAAQSFQNASMTGTGSYTPFSKTGGSGTSYDAGGNLTGSGGIFGASFSSGTPQVGGGGGGGGGATQTYNSWSNLPGYQGAPPGTPPPAWNPGDPLAVPFGGPDPGAGPMQDPTPYDPYFQPTSLTDPYNFNQYFQGPSSLWGTGTNLFGSQTPNMGTLSYFTSQPAYGGGGGSFSGYL